MVADKRHRPRRFDKFAVGGGIRFSEYIPTDVNKKERFALGAPERGAGKTKGFD